MRTARRILDYFSGRKTTAWQVLTRLGLVGVGLGANDLAFFVGLHAKTLQKVRFVNCGLTLGHIMSMFTVLEPRYLDTIEVSALDAELSIHYEDLLLLSATSLQQLPKRLVRLRSASYASRTIQIIQGDGDLTRQQRRDWWPSNPNSGCRIFTSIYCRPFQFYQERYSICWLWGRKENDNSIRFWRSYNTGWPTAVWECVHGTSGEVIYGDNPPAYWQDWDEDSTGDLAEPTPFDTPFTYFVSWL